MKKVMTDPDAGKEELTNHVDTFIKKFAAVRADILSDVMSDEDK